MKNLMLLKSLLLSILFFPLLVLAQHRELPGLGPRGEHPAPDHRREAFDAGWKFHLGDAADPAKDFNFRTVSIFSKTGKAERTAIATGCEHRDWRTLSVPHDWAVELPFENSPDFDVMSHGYKPVGGHYPATSIGWYRGRVTGSQKDSGPRCVLQFDGIFRDSRVWVNGFYCCANASGYSGFTVDVTDVVRYGRENVIVVR